MYTPRRKRARSGSNQISKRILLSICFIFGGVSFVSIALYDTNETVQFTHIISPFRSERSQNSTFLSMIIAKEHAASMGINVEIVAVALREDLQFVPLEFSSEVLSTSANSLYGEKFKNVPFLQNVLQRGTQNALGERIVFTNNDIHLRHDFYVELSEKMKDYSAIVVNRYDIDRKGGFHTHPGCDCFAWCNSLSGKIDVGEIFLGYPPIGYTFRNVLEKISNGSFRHYSSEVNMTYHLGKTSYHWSRGKINQLHLHQNRINRNNLMKKRE